MVIFYIFRKFMDVLKKYLFIFSLGMPKPIEIHAHDPLRYVGDMLAWIHQALASESESIHGLVEGQGKTLPTRSSSFEDGIFFVVFFFNVPRVLYRYFESFGYSIRGSLQTF